MKSVFVIASFNAIFFTVLLLQKKPKAKHDNILVLWLIYLGIFIGIYTYNSHEIFTSFQLLSISFLSLFMLHGVFLFFYVSSLVSHKKMFNLRSLLHFIPFILFNVYLIVISFFPEIAKTIRLDHVHSHSKISVIFLIFLILTAVSGPVYVILSIRFFKKHDIRIFNNFSYYENINLAWLRNLVYVFGIIWTALIAITIIHHVFNLFSPVFCTDGLFLSLSVFVILIGYFGFKQKVIFNIGTSDKKNINENSRIKYAGSLLSESDANEYGEKLNSFMVKSKPFLKPSLTLNDLASDLGISSHYLSQIINEKFELNFFEFINKQRVEEVKEKLQDSKFENYSLLGIALESGFNSKSAFNRIFKKYTGQTPSQYKAKSE